MRVGTSSTILLLLLSCANVSLGFRLRKKFKEEVVSDDGDGTLCSQISGDVDESSEGCWSACGDRCQSIHLSPDLQATHKLAAEPGQVRTCKLPSGKKSVRRFCVVKEAGVADVNKTAHHEKRRQRQTEHLGDDAIWEAPPDSPAEASYGGQPLQAPYGGQPLQAPPQQYAGGGMPQNYGGGVPYRDNGSGLSAATWILIAVGVILLLIVVLVLFLVQGKSRGGGGGGGSRPGRRDYHR